MLMPSTQPGGRGRLQVSTGGAQSAERLLHELRPHKHRRLGARERRVEIGFAAALVAVALALPLLITDVRRLDVPVALALVLTHAFAARVRVHMGGGSATPTQLVLVPMLFLVPATLLPALVAAGLLLANLTEAGTWRRRLERCTSALADTWHAVGAALVLLIAGPPVLEPAAGLLVGLALLGQGGADLLTSIARERLGRGIDVGEQLQIGLMVQFIDLCLTPVGMMAALASAGHPLGFLVVAPLLVLFASFAADRRVRIEQVGARLDELRRERVRLDLAVRRIGDAFAARLDAAAVTQLTLRTAVEAVGADYGRIVNGSVSLSSQPHPTRLEPAISTLLTAARGAGQTREHNSSGMFLLAVPMGAAGDGEASGALAVGRYGREFSYEERSLLGHLAARAQVAIEAAEWHERLRRQATVDELTGLANHRRFQETLAEEVDRSRRTGGPVSLVMMDVDEFKKVNDTHGHQQGDEVLRAVAVAVRSAVRGTDKPARYGGEEFAVVLPDTDLAGGWSAAEAIRRAVEDLRVPGPDGSALKVTVSLGVSCAGQGDAAPADLIGAADEALYEAKRAGRNRSVCARRAGRFTTMEDARPAGASATLSA